MGTKKRNKIIAQADKVVHLSSLEDANNKFGGLLLRVVCAHLSIHGFYTYTQNGVKVAVILDYNC